MDPVPNGKCGQGWRRVCLACKPCDTMFPPLRYQRCRWPCWNEAICPVVVARLNVKLCCLLSVSRKKHTARESRKPRVFLSTVTMSLSWGTYHQYLSWLIYVGERTWKFFVCSSICLKISSIFFLSSSVSKILFHVALFDILLSLRTLSMSILHNIRTEMFTR